MSGRAGGSTYSSRKDRVLHGRIRQRGWFGLRGIPTNDAPRAFTSRNDEMSLRGGAAA